MKIQKSVKINSSAENIWKILWDKKTYKTWTAAFCPPNSTYISSYDGDVTKEGTKVIFTNGEGGGMIAFVDEYKETEKMTFRHVGLLQNGKETFEGEEINQWKDAKERYHLKKVDENTQELFIEVDSIESMREFFEEAWNNSLQTLKELCEK
jgi:hypothetical protein